MDESVYMRLRSSSFVNFYPSKVGESFEFPVRVYIFFVRITLYGFQSHGYREKTYG